MKLLEFKCKLFGSNGTNDWYIEDMSLNKRINLLVGQNATGKSRVVRYLNTFIYLITDSDVFEDILAHYSKSEWSCVFQKDNGDIINYSVSFDFKKGLFINEEKLSLNDNVLLKRKNGRTEIFSFTNNKLLKISPPDNKLVLHIRRDTEEFPFFEDIVKWAEESFIYEFADEDAGKNLTFWFDQLSKESVEILKKDFNQLGYKLNNIFSKKNKFSDTKVVHIQEEGLEKTIIETDLSQGMSRALDLLTLVQYLLQLNETSIFMLDDIGEGLDYERATKLGKLLVEKIENSNIQLIATTNDSFLMDVIPIKYWNILQREGNTVRSLNYQNSKDLFDKFRLTGLSNFDLFSSDYLLQKQ